MTKPRRRREPPQQHGERLLAILTANLGRTTDRALRARLEAAIAVLRQKREAA
jgi:hypothetical protein